MTKQINKSSTIIPLSVMVSCLSLGLAGCSNSNNDAPSNINTKKSLSFTPVDTPTLDEQKRAIQATPTATINGTAYPTTYHTLIRSGDRPSSSPESDIYGLIYDQNNNPIYNADGSAFISDMPDYSSLLNIGGKVFMVSQLENSPGGMDLMELNQNTTDGTLSVMRNRHLDLSSLGGTWVHCAGTVTPWMTHFASEEYEPDAKKVDANGDFNDYYGMNQAKYFGLDPATTTDYTSTDLNAYNYGWITEVKVTDFDNASVAKHYSMGRFSHELAKVMPDNKTAYLTDDGTNVGLFRYVADTEKDMSAGTLYAAKWHQTNASNGGSATLSWLSLGHATDAEIKTIIDTKPKFTDIFDEDNAADGCASGFTSINTTAGNECLKIKPNMELAASRLESRRYAAMQTATTEFRKMEGLTYDEDNNRLYIAMSELARGMEDNMKNGVSETKYDIGGNNDIQVKFNRCGGVYQLDLDTNYLATNMSPLLMGNMTQAFDSSSTLPAYDSTGSLAANKCDIENLANPDNISYVSGYDTLLIGEDTGSGHQNDATWSYNLSDKKLTRIHTTPYGAENTSLYVYNDINNWSYITGVIQHPYGESDQDKSLPGSSEKRAYIGYFGPFPALK